jgi:hypothetical protein
VGDPITLFSRHRPGGLGDRSGWHGNHSSSGRQLGTVFAVDHGTPIAPATRTQRPLRMYFARQPKPRFECFEEQLSFEYRPIWDCSRQGVITYLCQPIPPYGLATALAGTAGFCTAEGQDEDRAYLDGVLLLQCAQRIEQSRKSDSRVRLGTPLHFTTLAQSCAWEHFKDIQQTICPDILRDIVFVVFDLHSVPNIRLKQQLAKLNRGGHIFCVTEPGDAVAAQFANAGADAVGIELPQYPPNEKQILGHIQSLGREARQIGCDSFILGVGSTSRALNAMAAGVRYLEGTAVHPSVTDPGHVFIDALEDLYFPHAVSG